MDANMGTTICNTCGIFMGYSKYRVLVTTTSHILIQHVYISVMQIALAVEQNVLIWAMVIRNIITKNKKDHVY